MKNQAKFFKKYLKLFETLILFFCASRQQGWELHLASLHCSCKYLFTFDTINYAHLRLVYLTKMFSLKEKDPGKYFAKAISLSIKHQQFEKTMQLGKKTEQLKCWVGKKTLQITKTSWMITFLLVLRWVTSSKSFVKPLTLTG